MRQRLIDHYPALVEKLVELHRRANKLFTADEDFFAQTVGKGLEEQVLPLEVPQETVHDVVSVTNHRAQAATLAVYDAFLSPAGQGGAAAKACRRRVGA